VNNLITSKFYFIDETSYGLPWSTVVEVQCKIFTMVGFVVSVWSIYSVIVYYTESYSRTSY